MAEVKISELDPLPNPVDGSETIAAVQAGTTYGATRDDLLHNVTDPSDLQDAATKNYVDLAVAAINTNTGSRIVSGGGVAWTGTNFDYIISACDYIINGVQYSSAQTAVTLDPADNTFDRIDTFYADADGLAGVITGTPADNPVAPAVDPATQIALTFAYVVANSTEPAVTSVDIYLENTEWTTSTNSAGTITLASTNNPYAGTKDIEGTNTASGNLFTAVKPSGTLAPSDYANLILQIRSKATWPNPKAISIFWMNGTSSVGTAATLKHGTFGFDSSNTTTYQQIVIPVSAFNTGAASADRIRFQVTGGGGNIGWYIDNIILQGGGATTTAGDFSTNTTTSVADEIVVFADTTGKLGKRSTGTGVARLTAGVLSATSPAALTKSDDTNITLTLGGAPTTALLTAASITAGWSGTLAVARGGTGAATASAHNYFGNNTGLSAAPGFHQIDYSELSGTPTIPSAGKGIVGATWYNAGSVLTTGKAAGYVVFPVAGTITAWAISLDTGTATIKAWKKATGTAVPTASDSINTSGVAISTGTHVRSTTLSDFTTTSVSANDIFAFNIESITGSPTELSFQIEITKT